jgi:hypothetical protein
MIKRPIFIALTTVPAILAPSLVSAQTQPNVVVPTIEFSGTGTSFNFRVTIDPNRQFVVEPIVVKGDKFIFNGGSFNPQDDLKVNIPISPSINPIGQSQINATVGNIGISSKTLFNLASSGSTFDPRISTSRININNTALRVDNDNPILTLP